MERLPRGWTSANAKLYIGLPASPDAAGGAGTFWLNPDETQTLVEDFCDRDNLGGIMLWESIRAEGRIDDGMTYYENVARILARLLTSHGLRPLVSCHQQQQVLPPVLHPQQRLFRALWRR